MAPVLANISGGPARGLATSWRTAFACPSAERPGHPLVSDWENTLDGGRCCMLLQGIVL